MAGKLSKEELIAQLLKKAETTTPAEAEALTEKAAELMLKYGIDRALLNSRSTSVKERIEKLHIPLSGIYSMAYMRMLSAIAAAFDPSIKTYYTQWKTDVTLTIVGFEGDVTQLKTLLASLQLQAVSALNVWWKSEVNEYARTIAKPMEKFKARRTFITSFGYGASERIRRARKTAVQEAESTQPGAELVLRSRATEVEEFMKANVGKLKSARNREKQGGFGATTAGIAAGRNANTGDRPVSAGQRSIGH